MIADIAGGSPVLQPSSLYHSSNGPFSWRALLFKARDRRIRGGFSNDWVIGIGLLFI